MFIILNFKELSKQFLIFGTALLYFKKDISVISKGDSREKEMIVHVVESRRKIAVWTTPG